MKNHELFEQFCLWWKCERGGNMKELAKELRITTATLYYWLRPVKKTKHGDIQNNGVPLRHLRRIEEISNGAFTRYNLRPDIFRK